MDEMSRAKKRSEGRRRAGKKRNQRERQRQLTWIRDTGREVRKKTEEAKADRGPLMGNIDIGRYRTKSWGEESGRYRTRRKPTTETPDGVRDVPTDGDSGLRCRYEPNIEESGAAQNGICTGARRKATREVMKQLTGKRWADIWEIAGREDMKEWIEVKEDNKEDPCGKQMAHELERWTAVSYRLMYKGKGT